MVRREHNIRNGRRIPDDGPMKSLKQTWPATARLAEIKQPVFDAGLDVGAIDVWS
jgi:hypothetical protein